MEEAAVLFVQHFTVLRTGSPEEIHNADLSLQQLTLHPAAIPALMLIIQQNSEPYFRLQAVLCLKLAYRGFANENSPAELINNLLTILSNEQLQLIRQNLVYFIGRYVINEQTIPLALNFAQAALQSNQPIQIHTAIQLLNSLVGIFEPSAELIQFVNQITSAALSLQNSEIALDAFEFAFSFHNKHHQVSDEATIALWTSAVSLLEPFFDRPNDFWSLCSILGDTIEVGPPYADTSLLLPRCLTLIAHDELDNEVEAGLVYIIDSICCDTPEAVLEGNFAIPIFQRYLQLAGNSFRPEESLDDYDASIMRNVCSTFSNSEQFVAAVWGAAQTMVQNEQGKYVAMITLQYIFNGDTEFLYDYLDNIAEMILASLTSPAIATSEAAISCMESFLDVYNAEAENYTDMFEEVLIGIIKGNPSIIYIKALKYVMKYSESTDNIFEIVLPILVELMQKYGAEENITLIEALTVLTQKSSVCVINHFNFILNILQTFLSNQAPDAQVLKSDIVECMSKLMAASPEQFEPCLASIVPFIMQSLNNEDKSLVCSCVNCCGSIIYEYPEQIQSTLPQMLPMMAELAFQDRTSQLIQLRKLEEQNCTPDDIDDAGLQEMISEDSLNVAGGAFLVFASILGHFPQFLPQWISKALEIISFLSGSAVENSTHAACKGVSFIMEGMLECQMNEASIFESMYVNMRKVIEDAESYAIIGDAIEAIAALCHYCGIAPLGNFASELPNDIIALLECNHKALSGMKLPQDLYKPISTLFFALFDKLSPEEISQLMNVVLPTILKFAESSSKKEKALALEILVNYAQHGNNPSQEFLPSLYNLAFNCASNDFMQGFYAIQKLSTIAPQLLAQNTQQLLQLFSQKLTLKKRKSMNHQMMIDNCVSALGAFAMNVMQDAFPIDQFGPLALDRMPPTVDVEETFMQYTFLLWMLPKGKGFMNSFVGAFARLLSTPPNIFKAMSIPEDNLITLKTVFVKLLQVVPNAHEICAEAVKNDPVKLTLLQQSLSS
ncbi:hypothetical protein TRFO_10684 [Tritrichomonas foetus]|uniref:Importin N-terminal domain-containing protein n=1 Tax=Tritrichomonas foetus TaxID=1144522 RepID=A0A1J4JBG0_9EUKA|nr:hypothetical protein TRFO_10684 [Tritrichomonas foetus]|eukprot:OHS94995.1 hypothetical protein TRFO_10684 [Tritrichomonas foetus]